MKELVTNIHDWVEDEKVFALATVIQTWGSSPRPTGSAMMVSNDLEMAGSVSGGCVEGAVLKEAQSVIEQGISKRLKYGITNEEAWAVGLTCGGKVQVFLERFMAFDEEGKKIWTALYECVQNNRACILLRKITEGKAELGLVYPDGKVIGILKDEALVKEALKANKERKSQTFEYEEETYFAQVFARKSQLLLIGAGHITADLIRLAKLYDFATVLIDPRQIFAENTQFAIQPDQVLVNYPSEVLEQFELDNYTYAVVLSHDPKIDDDALKVLLRSKVGYIGALGSRKTHAKRVERLQEEGFSAEEIGRIHAPIGLHIGAKKPSEIALSIMAELIKVKNGVE